LNHTPEVEEGAFEALRDAIAAGKLDPDRLAVARDRVMRLRNGFNSIAQPALEVVGCEEHRRLAREIADRSVTLVRDPRQLLPLSAAKTPRVAVIAPRPVDLTPAETNCRVRPQLAAELRLRGLNVDEFVCPLDPTNEEVAGFVADTSGHGAVVVGTYDAIGFPGQVALVNALTARKGSAAPKVLAVALRSPYDIGVLPEAAAVVCTYGVQASQMEALADALVGRIGFAGRLPVKIEPAS
jgi:beta-N-acetylhexosaminidase